MRRLALLLALPLAAAAAPRPETPRPQTPSPQTSSPQTSAEPSPAVQAYRAGDYATATELWRAELEEAEGRERARLAYDLGNAAFRAGDPLVAVGWYSLALRDDPRDGDLWANLEFARAEAGLEPADRGDLASTGRRLASLFTRAEAQWVFLLALVLWGAALAAEALLGRAWRRAAWAATGLLALAAVPLTWHALRTERPVMVVEKGGAAARSEPRTDAKTVTRLAAGDVVRWRDGVPGWVGVTDAEGRPLWLRESAAFDLSRGR